MVCCSTGNWFETQVKWGPSLRQTDVKISDEKQEITSKTAKGKVTKGEKPTRQGSPIFMRLKVLMLSQNLT